MFTSIKQRFAFRTLKQTTMRKGLLIGTTVALMGLAGLVNKAEASLMTFGDTNAPNNGIQFNSSSSDYVFVPFTITNNDNGTEYSGATLNATAALTGDSSSGFQALYNFGDNSATYADVNDMLTSQTGGRDNAYVSFDQDGHYVNSGWVPSFNANGSVSISFDGGRNPDYWIDNDPDADNNTVSGTIAVGSWLFDGNGNINDFTLDSSAASNGDAIPYINPDLFRSDSAVATTTDNFNINATGNYLSLTEAVPEPAVMGMLGLGSFGLFLYRRFKRCHDEQ